MSEQNRPTRTSENTADAVQTSLQEAAGATAVKGADGFSAEQVRAATESGDELKQAVAAASSAGQPAGVETTTFIDPGSGTPGAEPEQQGMTVRCRGFTGEGEEKEEGGLGTGPCIVTTEEQPQAGGGDDQEHVIRDPGTHVHEEEQNPHADGGCIRVEGEAEPPEVPTAGPDGADGTLIALGALIRTF